MQHLDEGTIHSWLDGALSADEAARAEAHVADCPDCAAAVAEARGFIAASSRILTALDTVPRGVIPIAPRATTRNWATWRAAAAVVVVALGSFAVLRNRTTSTPQRDDASVSAPTVPTLATTQLAADSQVRTGAQSEAADANTAAGGSVTSSRPPGTRNPMPAPNAREKLSDLAVAKKSAAPSVRGVTGFESRRSDAVATAPAPSTPPSAIGSVAGADALAMSLPPLTVQPAPGLLREIGRERSTSETRITYLLEEGDTVVLTEAEPVIRVRGVSTLRASGAAGVAATDRSANANSQGAGAAEQPQRSPESTAQKAATVAPTSKTAQTAVSPVNRVTWRDESSGKMLTLSGRVSASQLEAVKRRIELERSASKKNP